MVVSELLQPPSYIAYWMSSANKSTFFQLVRYVSVIGGNNNINPGIFGVIFWYYNQIILPLGIIEIDDCRVTKV